MERGEEMEKKGVLMSTHFKRAGVLTGLVLSFSLVFVGDSAPLTIAGDLSFYYIERPDVSEGAFSHGALLTSPNSLLLRVPYQASPTLNFSPKELFIWNLSGSSDISVNPSLRSPTLPRECRAWRHSTTRLDMGCSINSASGRYQALGFPLENSGLQEDFYDISADVPTLGVGQIPSDSPLSDEGIKRLQLLSNKRPNVFKADMNRVDRTAFKILGKEPHNTYPLFLGSDRQIVIMDALARIVPNDVLDYKSPTYWELLALLLLIFLPEGKRLKSYLRISGGRSS